MSIDLTKLNWMFKQAFSDKIDMYTNPNRKDELETYLIKKDLEIETERQERWKLENEFNIKRQKLQKLEKGKYKIKLLKQINDYTEILGQPEDIIEVYNNGARNSRGSMNRNQDDRALVFDYGMSGTDNYYPTIDFEIIEYLGKQR